MATLTFKKKQCRQTETLELLQDLYGIAPEALEWPRAGELMAEAVSLGHAPAAIAIQLQHDYHTRCTP